MYKITNANIKEWARDYDGEPFDAILCDHTNRHVNFLDLWECEDCGLQFDPFRGVWTEEVTL